MILVVGASGFLGSMITHQLLEKGESVRILQRGNPAYEDLLEAGAGVDVVITTANASQRGGDDTFESVDKLGTMNLIDAAKAAGVKQFIYISAFGSTPQSPVPLLRYKGECEAYLQHSGLNYTILKPNIFAEIWIGAVVGIPLKANQPVTLVEGGKKRHAFISVGDVAAVAVAAVRNESVYDHELAIGGSPSVTWTQIADMVGQTVGQTLPVNYVRMGEKVPLLPDVMVQLLYATETYETHIDMSEICQSLNLRLTPLENVIHGMFGNGR
jgi:uncharacterized protein YbjT (DUF2867 family)